MTVGQQVPVSREAIAEAVRGERALEVGPGVAWRRLGIVDVVLLGEPGAGDRGWALVDAGLPGTADAIAEAAAERFGAARPAAIVLTHGHFDHAGALPGLADRWDAPVHAHPAERPFLDGTSAYPPPDPGVGGGMMARLADLYPRGPEDLGDRLRPLPEDGSVPGPLILQLHLCSTLSMAAGGRGLVLASPSGPGPDEGGVVAGP